MDIELALKKRDRAISQLRDLYSSAESFGFTSSQINDRYSAINAGLVKCPSWTREYLSGYRRALDDMLYQSKLVYGGFYAGQFYSTHNGRADYYGDRFDPCDWSKWGSDGTVEHRGHYWLKHVDAGSPKHFFTGEH